jgi:hypothetical protein
MPDSPIHRSLLVLVKQLVYRFGSRVTIVTTTASETTWLDEFQQVTSGMDSSGVIVYVPLFGLFSSQTMLLSLPFIFS